MKAFMDWIYHSIERSVSVYFIGAILAVVLFGGWTFYRAFVKKPLPSTVITAQAGSYVDDRQFHQGFLSCMRIEAMKQK